MKKLVRYTPLLSALFLSSTLPLQAEETPAEPTSPAGSTAPEQVQKEAPSSTQTEAKKPATHKKAAHKKTRAHKRGAQKTETPAETTPTTPATEPPTNP